MQMAEMIRRNFHVCQHSSKGTLGQSTTRSMMRTQTCTYGTQVLKAAILKCLCLVRNRDELILLSFLPIFFPAILYFLADFAQYFVQSYNIYFA